MNATAEPRALAPPERRVARVVANEEVGAYRLVSALDVDGPANPRPGQFYMLAAAERWGGGEGERPYLPRAFSYARATPLGEGGGAPLDGPSAAGRGAASGEAHGARLDFLLECVGPGTERLAGLAEGDGLALVGPLGVGFRSGAGPALLVGGGIGVAPLLCLSDELPAAPVLLGFRSAAHAEAATLFRGGVELATDDGSAGRRALVTELLRERLDLEPGAAVYACGPPSMLEAVRALCAERDVAAQLALESGMACGFGACFGCAVPTRDGYVRICVDGPVLDAASLETALFPGAGH